MVWPHSPLARFLPWVGVSVPGEAREAATLRLPPGGPELWEP